MKICEVCGQEEVLEEEMDNECMQSNMIHVCESCQNDRRLIH